MNDFGQLGQGDTVFRADSESAGSQVAGIPFVNLGTGRTAKKISASGSDSICAILDNGSVKCWGGNPDGRDGPGNMVYIGMTPGTMGDALPAIQLWP